ncbi:MAG: S8 family serine peptidase [Bacteroidota bacterium]|nr:S8 family serine peptidase [Bacteroidota bacterium]
MKTITSSKIIYFAVAISFLLTLFIPAKAQDDPTKEILVYFVSGVERDPSAQKARIISSDVQNILTRFNIDLNKITSAFPTFNESDTLVTTEDKRVIKVPNMAKIFRIRIPDGTSREQIIDVLSKLPEVLFAEPNGTTTPTIDPNDQYFQNQWGLKNVQSGIRQQADIKAPEAWDIYKGNSNNIIAIIDGGIDGTHPDLSGKVSGDAGWGAGGHGIHVAGIASAKTNNTAGVSGVDWYAQLHSQRVDNTDDVGTYHAVVDAINHSPYVYVLNNSWNISPVGRYSTVVRLAFAYAYKQNRAAIATMGNTGHTTNTVQYPGSFGQGIIAVGATDQDDIRWNRSTYGNAIDVVAPGVSILSTFRNGNFPGDVNYHYESGTSMAAPHVSGIASLLKGYNSNLFNDDIENIIRLAVDDVNSSQYPGWDEYLGTGRVNARKALNYLRAPYQLTHAQSTGGSISQTVNHQGNFYGLSGNAPDGYYVGKKHEVRKRIYFSPTVSSWVWGRGVSTVGYSNTESGSSNFTMGYCEIVPGTLTSSSVELRTWVYEISRIGGGYYGWYPCRPVNVNFAYTVHGRVDPLSASISGPNTVYHADPKGSPPNCYTWTTNISGGAPPYMYTWYKNDAGVGTSSSYPECFSWNGYSGGSYQFTLRVNVVDAISQTATASLVVTAYNSGGGLEPIAQHIQVLPDEFNIAQNHPNPFNPETQINYALPEPSHVILKIYDVLGCEVAVLVNEYKEAGYYEVTWDARLNNVVGQATNVPSGVYFYRLQSGNFNSLKKMLLMR